MCTHSVMAFEALINFQYQVNLQLNPVPPTFIMARPLVLLDRSVASSVPMPFVLVHHIYESYQQEPTSTTLVATTTSCNVDLN